MENEIWKDIPDYEGLYQVSNLGRVKSLPRERKSNRGSICKVRERIMKPTLDSDGYIHYGLSRNSKTITFKSHRLVAICFIPNPNPLLFNQINHIDGNKLNNRPENLEWCDAKHNNHEALRIGLRGGRPYRPRIDSPPISQFKGDVLVENYDCLAEAARKTGILKNAILNCLKGRSKSSGGYRWEYTKK